MNIDDRGSFTELLREFTKKTRHTLLMYRQKGFLKDAQADIQESTEQEVERVSEEDRATFSQQVVAETMERLISKQSAVPAYPAVDFSRLVLNPLQTMIESQNRLQKATAVPWAGAFSTISAIMNPAQSMQDAIAKLVAGVPVTSIPDWMKQLNIK